MKCKHCNEEIVPGEGDLVHEWCAYESKSEAELLAETIAREKRARSSVAGRLDISKRVWTCHKCKKQFRRQGQEGMLVEGVMWGRHGDPSHGNECHIELCGACTAEFYKWCYPKDPPNRDYVKIPSSEAV